MIQPGFFDLQDRLHKIDKTGDPLAKINETVNRERFRPALEKARDKGGAAARNLGQLHHEISSVGRHDSIRTIHFAGNSTR